MADETGRLKVNWFNHRFLKDILSTGTNIAVAGLVERQGTSLVIQNPELEILTGLKLITRNSSFRGADRQSEMKNLLIHTGRLVPVYPETRGLTSKWLRNKIANLLNINGQQNLSLSQIEDWLPPEILTSESLLDLKTAVREIHFPSSPDLLAKARNRLEFDEIFKFQANGLIRRKLLQEKTAPAIPVDRPEINRFISSLPFKLTPGQIASIDQILSDLNRPFPMNRLLQGDVGSGKTIVAAAAALSVIKAGYQVAFMVPTQILADQHATTLTNLLKPLGVKIALLTGATKLKFSGEAGSCSAGKISNSANPDLIIGTQALIHKRSEILINKQKLALVIIDEQHRFGVEQRAKLTSESVSPHVLSMTATPIPRTVALTLYSDLDVSTLTDMPKGRIPVKTWIVPETKRLSAYSWITDQVKHDSQVFIICPFVEDSTLETLKSVKAVSTEFEKLKTIFKGLRLDLVHGRLKPKLKTQILSDMKAGKIDILVATPVVEVGVDIPNAKIIVIEGAERFGLAQLHQLRGRVGRNNSQSYCLLFTSGNSASGRLKMMENIANGFRLAEMDLKMRGPGSIWTILQHGWPEFKIADISDFAKVNKIRHIAEDIINNTGKYPQIKSLVNSVLEKPIALN